jgi:DNA-binding YbaB/EbfC family protein
MFEKLKYMKDLRGQAKQMQNALAGETAEGSAAWGKVKIIMNGNQEILSVTIDQELMKVETKDKLESAVKEATNDVIKKIQKIMAEKMRAMGGFPGLQ